MPKRYVQARDATESVRRSVGRQLRSALAIAGAVQVRARNVHPTPSVTDVSGNNASTTRVSVFNRPDFGPPFKSRGTGRAPAVILIMEAQLLNYPEYPFRGQHALDLWAT